MIIMVAAMLVIVGGIFSFKFYQAAQSGKASASQMPPPVTISAETVREDTWQPALRTTGSLVAVQGVVLSNEFAGVVENISFESGDVVQKGALLVQLNIATDQAQLRSYEAAAVLARLNLERAKALRESDVNAQADLDNAQAQFDQALANADNARSIIAKKSIAAPFSGRLGIRQVNLGQFLPVGTTIVSLQSLDPIYVNFALPQQNVCEVVKGQTVELSVDAYPGVAFKGAISAFDSQIDGATRAIRVQATLENKDGRLQPGMFGTVAVLLPQQEKVITVPQTAVTYNPYGNIIYVIETAVAPGDKVASGSATPPMLTVRQQFVKLGETRGDQVAVISGLKPGDRIATSGQLKLRDGVNVQIDNSVPASNNPNSTPPNA
jgi:membrane fusion protein (multidrug efflux system)